MSENDFLKLLQEELDKLIPMKTFLKGQIETKPNNGEGYIYKFDIVANTVRDALTQLFNEYNVSILKECKEMMDDIRTNLMGEKDGTDGA